MKTVVLTVVCLLISTQAAAYKLYHTKSGKTVRWATSYVEVVLDETMAELGDRDDVTAALQDAFDIWAMDANLPLVFDLVWDQCEKASNDGNNCIYACADRSECYSRPEEKGGTTYVSVSPSSGHINDADIVLNADSWEWDVDGSSETGLSLGRVMSHEIGHFLGIDHSEDSEAIMYPILSRDAEVAESLHYDDREAAETLYENFVDIDELANDGACAVARVGRTGNAGSYLAMLLVTLIAAMRLRRQRAADLSRQGQRENR